MRLFLAAVLVVSALSAVTASLDFSLEAPNFRAATPASRQPAQTIEWSVPNAEDESSLYLLLQTDGAHGHPKSQLLTFPVEITIAKVLATVKPILAPKATQCTIVDQKDRVIDQDNQLGELLTTHAHAHGGNDLSMSCTSNKKLLHRSSSRVSTQAPIVFQFRHFVPQAFHGNEVRGRTELRNKLTGATREYPLEAAELVGAEWSGIWGWVDSFLKYHWGPMHAYPDYTESTTQTGRWHLNTGAVLTPESTFGPESDEPVRIAVAADWAAGTRESDYVQAVMMNGNGTNFNPHWTLHVGDIYYVGAPEWVNSNCLGIPPSGVQKAVTWPHGSLGSFAVQGNHEAYDRSFGFFDTFLPTLGANDASGKPQGQEAGFVSLENAYFRVLMLDTGYNTYSPIPLFDNKNNTQPQAVMDWLVNVVNISDPTDTRGIIIFTHHQVESAFGSGEPSQATPNQIAAVLPEGRQVLWLFGHEHRLSFYKIKTLPNDIGVYPRCIGNSGFPTSMSAIPLRANSSGLEAYDDRQYTIETGIFNMTVAFNGFTHLELVKNSVSLTYSTLAIDPSSGELSSTLQTDLVTELFTVDPEGDMQLSSFAILDDGITVINNPE